MSCNLKNSRQSNAYDRSDYDLKMLEAYNPMKNLPAPVWPGYHSPPYPGERTEYDMRVQSMWSGPKPAPTQSNPYHPSGSGSNRSHVIHHPSGSGSNRSHVIHHPSGSGSNRSHPMGPHHNYSYSY